VSRDPDIRMQAARAFDGAPVAWNVSLHREPTQADVIVCGPDVPIEGAIAFDPNRPAATLEDVARLARETKGRVVVVTAPRGGMGVTSIALHLAQAAASSRPTCYVDLNADSATVVRLKLDPDARLWDPLDDDAAALRRSAHPVPGGFRVLKSATRPEDEAAAIERVAAEWTTVVVDAPAARHEALEPTLVAVLVMAPTVPAAHSAREMLEAHPHIRWAVVANRLGPGGETTRRGLERILGRSIAVELPVAPSLRDAEDDGRLITNPWSRWRRGVERLARALELK
jgi:MinD-like ATPase involved in chromosome partitioning or flagellar assembly